MFTFVNLWELSNHTLFDEIQLPTGSYLQNNNDGSQHTVSITPDKDILINSIFDEVAEMQPLTIDVNVMKMKINNFFLKYKTSFEHLIAINLVEYSPIENTDKYETHSHSLDRQVNSKRDSTNTSNETLTTKVSAYDSPDFQNSTQDSTETTGSNNDTGSDTIKDVESNTIRAHGNIGVTTNQQMLTAEVDFWNKFSFYKIVADKFMFELCLTCETYE